MAQTLILLEEKGLTDEDALDQRIAELDTKFHESLAVVKDLETRMADNQKLRSHAADYKQYRPLAQKLKTVKHPAVFEEQHRAELTAYRAAAAYLKANNITSRPVRTSWKRNTALLLLKRPSSMSSTGKPSLNCSS